MKTGALLSPAMLTAKAANFSLLFNMHSIRRVPDAVVFFGLALGAFAGHTDIVWPHFTVSDILESGGGRLVYTSWALAFATEYALNRRIYRGGFIAMMWPLFRVTHGKPVVLQFELGI
jgi:hypothetical protein